MKWLYSGYAVAVSIALLLALRVVDPTPLQSLRGQVFDSYQQLDEIQHSENVVILNIGEQTLAKYGQYPFPRQYYAQMVIDLATKNSVSVMEVASNTTTTGPRLVRIFYYLLA